MSASPYLGTTAGAFGSVPAFEQLRENPWDLELSPPNLFQFDVPYDLVHA